MARPFALLSTVIALALAAPFFLYATIPLHDLPNHIARQAILFGGAPGAAAYYEPRWRLVPNLALEGFVCLLHFVMPVGAAVRVFLAAAAVQLFLGTLALRRAVAGADRGLVLAAPLFVLSGPFLFGFASECFATGMALWALALWLGVRGRAVWQIPLALVAALILMAHAFGFAVYALGAVAIAAGEVWRGRASFAAAARDTVHLALPAALFLAIAGGSWSAPEYGSPRDKAEALEWAVGLFDPRFDAGLLAAVGLGLLALASRLTVAPQMRAPLAALAAAFVLLPHKWGDATFIDARVPPVLLLLLAASLNWRDERDPARLWSERAAVSLFALRWIMLVLSWASWQPTYAQIRAALDLLPQGARLIELGVDPEKVSVANEPPLAHVAAYAVAARGALIPTMFADGPHDLLSYRAPYAAFHRAPSAGAAGAYDYFLLIDPARIDLSALPPAAPIAAGSDFVLLRRTR